AGAQTQRGMDEANRTGRPRPAENAFILTPPDAAAGTIAPGTAAVFTARHKRIGKEIGHAEAHGLSAHHPSALECAVVDQHLEEAVIIARRAGESGASERERGLVEVDGVISQVDRYQRSVDHEIARRHPISFGARDLEVRVVHAEWIEEALLQEAIKRLP